jgi:GNAT superfamily N-acetyltransferase
MLPVNELRRIEECALNASGGMPSLLYDGWLLGFRPGGSKRPRCVNAFHSSTLPLAEKIAHCVAFYRSRGLPPLFRLLPFSQPPELDGALERDGWTAFERTLVQHVDFASLTAPALPEGSIETMPGPEWVAASAPLLGLAGEDLVHAVDREVRHPLSQVGVVIRRDDVVIACGLAKLERGLAGLFSIHTAAEHRGHGLGRAIVAALVAEALRHGARRGYLQVTAANASAIALYRRFGFATAYDYWYRRIES